MTQVTSLSKNSEKSCSAPIAAKYLSRTSRVLAMDIRASSVSGVLADIWLRRVHAPRVRHRGQQAKESPGDLAARRGWDSNPRNGLPLGRFQGACTSPLCDLAPAQLDGSGPQDPRIVAEALDGSLGRVNAIVAREAGAPEVLELADLPTPEAGPGHVLGEGTAPGVNRGDGPAGRGPPPPPPG